ncbi:MAG: TonB family protein [Cyanobacteria bacterium SIG31]|nr:TonB family protein [Cyanobacteria bacterium SIG31]
MKNSIIIFAVCILSSLSINAYEYSSHYDRPTSNQQLQIDFSEYMENIRNKLQKNWSYPDFLEEGHIKVLFKLDREGYVISGDILESSGNPVYDESAVDAIHKSEPFGKFPENSTRQTLTINYSFDSSLVKTDKLKEYYDKAKRYAHSDKKEALRYINIAVAEAQGNPECYFLYKHRAKIKEDLGDHIGAKEDLEEYINLKTKIDIKRIHALKHRAEVEDSAFAYYHLAYAYELLKDYKNAINAIDKAIEKTELNQNYKQYRNELLLKNNRQKERML